MEFLVETADALSLEEQTAAARHLAQYIQDNNGFQIGNDSYNLTQPVKVVLSLDPPGTSGMLAFSINSGQVRSGRVWSGRVRSGQVKSGQVRSSQVKSGQVRSGPALSVEVQFKIDAVA